MFPSGIPNLRWSTFFFTRKNWSGDKTKIKITLWIKILKIIIIRVKTFYTKKKKRYEYRKPDPIRYDIYSINAYYLPIDNIVTSLHIYDLWLAYSHVYL